MSTAQWSQSSSLNQLFAQPQSFEFIQAVRLIRNESKLNNIKIEINYRSSLSLSFPLAEIESLTLLANDGVDKSNIVELYPAVIGLTGPLAALPTMYTDYLASRKVHLKDKAAPAFLDIFNQRLTELYVDSSWFYNLPLQYELNTNKDRYLLSLRALARQPKKITSIDSLIGYAGMIAPGRLTAEQLAHVLSKFFKLKISVEQFVPEWFKLPMTEQTSLGGKFSQLGVSTFCGERVVQFDSKIRVVCHELDADSYFRLMPSGDMCRVIVEFLRKWCGVNLSVEMQLQLHKKNIKPLSLAEKSFGSLGRGGFLVSKPANDHHDDMRYLLPFNVAH